MTILQLAGPPEWTLDALCAQVDPESFFPERGDNAHAARRVCRGCPVRIECLDYALTYESDTFGIQPDYLHANHGIWGGLTPRERRKIIRTARRAS